ncbi:MAG: anti-sigma factor [Alphaproteobacteria bacterium HGW-Alphaproteobacteria-6]|nr:MAG: anti-sigma factor [Alphaproteobacteria bacterium HGW-Alphaproteobacteria-8]PKP75023.1 MAG: anti-sigma factor [Alphaproteobacteria bacterium HGW-Alphaproteobacteria-6]
MLNCRDFAEQADALIDEELGPWQAMRLRLHLSACKGCARFFEQLRLTRRLSEAATAPGTDGDDGETARIDALLAAARGGVGGGAGGDG